MDSGWASPGGHRRREGDRGRAVRTDVVGGGLRPHSRVAGAADPDARHPRRGRVHSDRGHPSHRRRDLRVPIRGDRRQRPLRLPRAAPEVVCSTIVAVVTRSAKRRPPLLVIAGATATGKTGLAIDVASAWSGRGSRPRSSRPTRARSIAASTSGRRRRPRRAARDPAPRARPRRSRRAVHGRRLRGPRARALAAIGASGGLAILAGGTGLYLRAIARGMPGARHRRCGDARPAGGGVQRGRPGAARRAAGFGGSGAGGPVDTEDPRRVVRDWRWRRSRATSRRCPRCAATTDRSPGRARGGGGDAPRLDRAPCPRPVRRRLDRRSRDLRSATTGHCRRSRRSATARRGLC